MWYGNIYETGKWIQNDWNRADGIGSKQLWLGAWAATSDRLGIGGAICIYICRFPFSFLNGKSTQKFASALDLYRIRIKFFEKITLQWKIDETMFILLNRKSVDEIRAFCLQISRNQASRMPRMNKRMPNLMPTSKNHKKPTTVFNEVETIQWISNIIFDLTDDTDWLYLCIN